MQNFRRFELVEHLPEQSCTIGCLRPGGRGGVKQPLPVFRLVQIFAEPARVILNKKIEFLSSRIYLWPQLLQLVFLMLEPEFEVIEGGLQVGRIARTKKLGEETIAPLEALSRVLALFLERGDVHADGLD